jgi:excisionase family DNA binding protein
MSDLSAEDGRPLTTHELAQMIGMSSTFVRTEIRSGHLRAIRVGSGRKRVYRIPISEARLYLSKIGLV